MGVIKTLNSSKYSFINKGWYLGYYFTYNSSEHDYSSGLLLDFKKNYDHATTKWVDVVVNNFNPDIDFDLIVRVLNSNETNYLSHSPIDKIGNGLSKALDVPYIPNSLKKKRATQQLKGLKKVDRKNEISGVYEFYPPSNNHVRNILVIDDIITTGSTIKEIKRAISEKISNFNLYLLVLGKTYDSWADENANNKELNVLLQDSPKVRKSFDTGISNPKKESPSQPTAKAASPQRTIYNPPNQYTPSYTPPPRTNTDYSGKNTTSNNEGCAPGAIIAAIVGGFIGIAITESPAGLFFGLIGIGFYSMFTGK